MDRVLESIIALVMAVLLVVALASGFHSIKSTVFIVPEERTDAVIRERETLIFGTPVDVQPLCYARDILTAGLNERNITGYMEENGLSDCSIEIAYAKQVAKKMGVQLKIVYIPRENLRSALVKGKVDMISAYGFRTEDLSGLYVSGSYYTLQPVLVYMQNVQKASLDSVSAIRYYEGSLLKEIIDPSRYTNVAWHGVTKVGELAYGNNEHTVYLTDKSAVPENREYTVLKVSDPEKAQCKFVCRVENENIQREIENTITAHEDVKIKEVGTVFNATAGNGTYAQSEVLKAVSGNNVRCGNEVFVRPDGYIFVSCGDQLYQFDSKLHLYRTMNNSFLGSVNFAIGSKIYCADNGNSVRVMDVTTQTLSSSEINLPRAPFKKSSFRDARRILKNDTISEEEFMKLTGMFASGRIGAISGDYYYKSRGKYFVCSIYRFDSKTSRMVYDRRFGGLFGGPSRQYVPFDQYIYPDVNTRTDFKTKKKVNDISSCKLYTVDDDGNIICVTSENEVVFCQAFGEPKTIYRSEEVIQNCYASGDYVFLSNDQTVRIVDKNGAGILQKVGEQK